MSIQIYNKSLSEFLLAEAGQITGAGADATRAALGMATTNLGMVLPKGFSSQSFVDPNETLQAAVDRAPASATLVQEYTTGFVNLTGGVWALPLPSKPVHLYLDADAADESDIMFTGNALANPDVFLNAILCWKWDAANSQAVIYNKGAALTQVTTVKYHAVVALNASEHDSVALRPGIVIVGPGKQYTKIRNITNKNVPGPSGVAMRYALAAASYSGAVGFTVELSPNAFYSEPKSYVGLVLPLLSFCDCFFMKDCELVATNGLTLLTGYHVLVWTGCHWQHANMYRAKNVRIMDTPISVNSPIDAIETYSIQFGGRVFFERCPVKGGVFVDGRKNTFYFIDSPIKQGGSYAPDVRLSVSGGSYPINLGSVSCWDTHQLVLINSPVDARLPLNELAATGKSTGFYQSSSAQPVLLINSPVYADTLVTAGESSPLTSAQARSFTSVNSPTPPAEVTTTVSSGSSGLSASNPSPLLNRSVARLSYATQTTTAKQFGQLNLLGSELRKRGQASTLVRGKFAANANTKTLKARAGIGAALPITVADIGGGGTVTGALNGSLFEMRATLTATATTVQVVGTLTVGGAVTAFQAEYAMANTDYVTVLLDIVGVATNDAVVNFQELTIAG